MSEVFEMLQGRYRDLVDRVEEEGVSEGVLDAARAFLTDARQAGAVVADPQARGQLRAYARFLATLLQDAREGVPRVDLLPLDRERWPAQPPPERAPAMIPWWGWALLGAAALVVLAALIGVAGASVGALPLQPSPTPTVPLPTATPVPPTPTFTPTPLPPTATPTPSPTPTPELGPPVFSDLVVALGMEDADEPFLPAEVFDWNTKAVYAVFDYAGMRDGLSWSAVWTRGEEELAREEYVWDVGEAGRTGTRWVVYFEPDGRVLRGGEYTVSLTIEGEVEATASFRIQFYVTPTP
jgi:hypothetical protein